MSKLIRMIENALLEDDAKTMANGDTKEFWLPGQTSPLSEYIIFYGYYQSLVWC